MRTLLVCRAVHRVLLLCAPEPPGRDPDLPDQLVPTRNRVSFAKLDEVLPLPDLVAIQRESFDWLLSEGIKEVLEGSALSRTSRSSSSSTSDVTNSVSRSSLRKSAVTRTSPS